MTAERTILGALEDPEVRKTVTDKPPAAENTALSDFIRDIVADDLEANKNGGRVVTRFPPEPQRLPPRRTRQVRLAQLRHRLGERRRLQPQVRRHQPHQGGRRVHQLHPGRPPMAGRRLERGSPLLLRLLRRDLRVRRQAGQERKGIRLRPQCRPDQGVPRHSHRARTGQPLPRPHQSRRTSICWPA